jgi:N-formylglutamate deformylase
VLRDAIPVAERARLVAQWYEPHHWQLTRAVNAILAVRGKCLVIDCHSFASAALPYELDQSNERPEICLGTDAYHTPTALVEAAHEAFVDAGFTVALNRPFAGALVPAAHYQRDARVRALMVEVNRGLYVDEKSGMRGAKFNVVRERVQSALLRVLATAEAL